MHELSHRERTRRGRFRKRVYGVGSTTGEKPFAITFQLHEPDAIGWPEARWCSGGLRLSFVLQKVFSWVRREREGVVCVSVRTTAWEFVEFSNSLLSGPDR